MPELHKSLLSSSLASVLFHGMLISGFSGFFYRGSELSQDAGVSRLNVQLKPVDVAQEPIIDSPEPLKPISKTNVQEKVSENEPQPSIVKNQQEQKPVIASHKPAKEKATKIEDASESKKPRAEVQNQPKTDQPPNTAEASSENEKESATDASTTSLAESANKVDPVKLWLAELQQRINQHRHYPRQAIKRRLESDVRVKAVINPDGSLAHANVLSGHRSFHGDSLRSLQQALPFPPPKGTNQPISIVFTIHYKLK